MNKKPLLVAAAVVALLLVGAVAWLLTPAEAAPYEDEVPVETASRNAGLYAALLTAGIEDPFVDVDEERVYVAYDLPPAPEDGNATEPDVLQRFVVGAAANAAPDVARIVVAQHRDGEVATVWTVEMSDFLAFVRGEIDGEEFESRIAKT